MRNPVKARSIPISSQNESANPRCSAANLQVDATPLSVQDATPAMRQYITIKNEHADCLLFYRMGDFYELFFDDAKRASEILDIALTKRGKHGDQEIPMCGVPVHSHEVYLDKLIASGHKVAICEQTETPEEAKKRGGHKAVVNREVVRIVTPGTITEDNLLSHHSNHFLAAIAQQRGQVAIAWLDITSGAFYVMNSSLATLSNDLARINPKEVLIADKLIDVPEWQDQLGDWYQLLSIQSASQFEANKAERAVKEHFAIQALDALGDVTAADIAACGALLNYLNITQVGTMPRLELPSKQQASEAMVMDAATRRNLELVATLTGSRKGSLLSVIDRTITGAGARLLAAQLTSPLTNHAQINARLDTVEYAITKENLRNEIRDALRECPDIERALSRICLGRGGPRDLLALAKGLHVARSIKQQCVLHHNQQNLAQEAPALLQDWLEGLGNHAALVDEWQHALQDDVPMLARDGNFVADGYRADLDEFRHLRDHSKQLIADMQERLRKESGITSLKIKFNNVLGYFIDITATHADKVPEGWIHRQSLANNMRYTTTELSDIASKIADAANRALEIEQEVFAALVAQTQAHAPAIAATARAIAQFDVGFALAELAVDAQLTRPEVDGSTAFAIERGRHVVVENALQRDTGDAFIANDCDLSEQQRLWLLTGPNMAGKSTFLRQNALIAIMAQMGAYVPAHKAHIGVVDRLFSRVGAADDLARGRSTFMVEMVETATILNQSTERSLVILDEIGRGTATFDGLSIAWAVVEYLHNQIGCRGLFATHYHELTELTDSLAQLSCYTMKVKEWKGEVKFLHQVEAGTADRSYGIHVAQLAGLPAPVIQRSQAILQQLESEKHAISHKGMADSLPLFHYQPEPASATPSVVDEKLASINPDELSPREALEALYNLKALSD